MYTCIHKTGHLGPGVAHWESACLACINSGFGHQHYKNKTEDRTLYFVGLGLMGIFVLSLFPFFDGLIFFLTIKE
jgi:hypothetical protein